MMRIQFAAVVVALFAVPAVAAEDPRVAAEVIGIAQTQMAAGVARKPMAERIVAAADDFTVFNSNYPVLIDGKAAVLDINTAFDAGGGKPLSARMAGPKVQVYGDTAILTYNGFGVNQDKDGKTTPNNAKVTRVYVKQGGRWQMVHAHLSPVTPPAN